MVTRERLYFYRCGNVQAVATAISEPGFFRGGGRGTEDCTRHRSYPVARISCRYFMNHLTSFSFSFNISISISHTPFCVLSSPPLSSLSLLPPSPAPAFPTVPSLPFPSLPSFLFASPSLLFLCLFGERRRSGWTSVYHHSVVSAY